MTHDPHPGASRRQVMATGVVTMAGMAGLAACGSSSSGAGAAAASPSAGGAASSSPSAGGAAAASSSAGGGVLATLADVKVGTAISAKTPDGKPIIIAEPTAGHVVAFTAICTHMGCTVLPVGGLKLQCPCHGSKYDAATGQVTHGPAPLPLAAVPVKVDGNSIVEA